MKGHEHFKNNYPHEELLPDLKEGKEHVLSANCDTYNAIDWQGIDISKEEVSKANQTLIDTYCEGLTAEHFKEGYEYAKAEIEKKLMPCEIKLL